MRRTRRRVGTTWLAARQSIGWLMVASSVFVGVDSFTEL
jgi:hypothetical protein